MKAEDKTSLKVRIAVLGHVNVGKSALTVRYLTRRFIGEYRSGTDLKYHQMITIDNSAVDVEILDGTEIGNDYSLELLSWADSIAIVYSVIDRESFTYAKKVLSNLKLLQNGPSAYLIANKADLQHMRKVDESEGAKLAASHSIGFCEVSVADNSPGLYTAFERLIHDSKARPVKQRKFSVSKILGIGNKDTKSIPLSQGSTMVACSKEDFLKSRTGKRRQGFIAMASL